MQKRLICVGSLHNYLYKVILNCFLQVLPYCFFNLAVQLTLFYIDHRAGGFNVKISSQAHTFVTLIVSFLLVSRVNIGLARYNASRDALGVMYRESRELIQNACVFTGHDTSTRAKEWRFELTYRACLLLRLAMAVIDYQTTFIPAWEVPELTGEERELIHKKVFLGSDMKRWGEKPLSEWEESMRVPIHLAYLLRQTVHSQEKRIRTPMQVSHENKLHSAVDNFMVGYYGIRKFLSTPLSFPLVQMSRTFCFVYVFSLPFVLVGDDSGVIAHVLSVFFITFGFVGLEFLAIELDDPFGDDPNDFDNNAIACTAYEDTYLTILDLDGPQWADRLRLKMQNGQCEEVGNEMSWLLGDKMV